MLTERTRGGRRAAAAIELGPYGYFGAMNCLITPPARSGGTFYHA